MIWVIICAIETIALILLMIWVHIERSNCSDAKDDRDHFIRVLRDVTYERDEWRNSFNSAARDRETYLSALRNINTSQKQDSQTLSESEVKTKQDEPYLDL